MNKRLTKKAILLFDSLRRTDEAGKEFWSSRDLAKALTYTDYRNFLTVIGKAKKACENSGQKVEYHFVDVNDMIIAGKGAERQVDTVLMSRYACYLAVQNADPGKPIVAQAEDKLRRKNISSKQKANDVHFLVGAKVRQTIKELGGTMPEDLPTAESIKAVESKQKKLLRQKNNPE